MTTEQTPASVARERMRFADTDANDHLIMDMRSLARIAYEAYRAQMEVHVNRIGGSFDGLSKATQREHEEVMTWFYVNEGSSVEDYAQYCLSISGAYNTCVGLLGHVVVPEQNRTPKTRSYYATFHAVAMAVNANRRGADENTALK